MSGTFAGSNASVPVLMDLVICANSFAADQSPERHILLVASPDQAETVARLTAYYLNADISVDPPVPCQNWRDYCSAVRQHNSIAVFSTSPSAGLIVVSSSKPFTDC